jgi:ACS family tartrate transporter-like MFS transporter
MLEAPSSVDPIARSAVAKMSRRILPLILLGYLVSFMDRVNIGFAAIQMNADLGFSATVFGLGAGLFYLAYASFEVPSNVFLTRYGARRWIARIMISWGLVASGMMFVQTPLQFYAMRFLLGMAEAGFFPGVIYYLAHWFPRAHRGRAISRFYIAGPLGSVVMGSVSGALLGLDGAAGLHGWQWLLLVQGSPAVFVGLLVLRYLPDAPHTARWLTDEEKAWVARELVSDAARIREPASHDVLAALRNPFVLQFGLIGLLTIGSMVTLGLSGPLVLTAATGLDATRIGYVVGLGGILGVLSMLVTGWYSDRRGERFATMLASTVLMGIAFLLIALTDSPAVVVAGYLLFAASWTAVTLSQVMAWPDVLHLRLLAVGSAAINTASQIGAFLMPLAWGAAKDATGSYRFGLLGLASAAMLASVLTLALRRQVRSAHPLEPVLVAAEA